MDLLLLGMRVKRTTLHGWCVILHQATCEFESPDKSIKEVCDERGA